MKHLFTFLLFTLLSFQANAQLTLFDEDFETGYTAGNTALNVSPLMLSGWGNGFTFTVVNDHGNGAGSSNFFTRMNRGGNGNYAAIQNLVQLESGKTYVYKISIKPALANQKAAYKLQVIDTVVDVIVAGGNTGVKPTTASWNDLTISYTAGASQNYAFRITKDWGNAGADIDNISLVCTDCSETFTNGSVDNQWATASNWSSGSVPTSSEGVTISSGQTIEVGSSTTAVANSITIESGGSLTVAKNSDLTLTGDFTNNGTVTLNSDSDEFASIIVGGSSTGDIVYNRYVNTQGSGEWDLIGAPVDGLSISSFVTTNSSPLATSGSTYAVGVYDNSDGSWTNYTSSTVASAGNFDIGKGYQMATASGATMAFTGTIATTDQTQSIINNAGSGGSRWNLVANPYPSYLNANTSADASNNFLSVNSGVIDSSYLAVYGYNADGTGYTIYNNTSSATYIAPGQAFFVAAASPSSASLSFTEAMQTTTGGDDFIALSVNTSSTFYLKLYEDQDFIADTRFYFDSNLTLGLDPGYDAGSHSQSTAIGSRLVEEDQGITMGINAMGIDSLEEATIPLVINRAAGVAFRVSLEGATIPHGTKVYLEDTQQATFTDLRAGDFTLNPQSELSGMGRFYLRLGSIALSVDELEDSDISIYKQKAEKHITIEGLSNVTKARVKLYNLLGQELLSQDLEANISTQNISTDGITTGVYIVKLSVNGKKITKKVIVD